MCLALWNSISTNQFSKESAQSIFFCNVGAFNASEITQVVVEEHWMFLLKGNMNYILSSDKELLYSWPKYSMKKIDLSKEASNLKQFLLFSVTVV